MIGVTKILEDELQEVSLVLFFTFNGYCIASLITQQRIEGLFGVFMELISADIGNVRFS